MGFPTWTLWGMGLSAAGALMAIALAFLAQSPRLLSRLNLTGQRLDLRARGFTGYGLALLVLALGFFAAGVPLGRQGAPVVEATPAEGSDLTAALPTTETTPGSQSGAMVGLPTSAGGAMVGLGTPAAPLTGGLPISGTVELPPTLAAPSPAPESTATPPPTNTLAPTITPTPTPSPTPTATPILEPTARIGEGTSTLPVRRGPAGPVLVVLVRGDIVIPLSGHAFHSGEVWREISTVAGTVGWVPEQFLDYSATEP